MEGSFADINYLAVKFIRNLKESMPGKAILKIKEQR